MSKNALLDRFTKFAQGQWLDLLTQSVAASAAVAQLALAQVAFGPRRVSEPFLLSLPFPIRFWPS